MSRFFLTHGLVVGLAVVVRLFLFLFVYFFTQTSVNPAYFLKKYAWQYQAVVVYCCTQWRSKVLRVPGSTVNFGPSLSLPSTSPPSPPLSLLFPSPAPAGSGAEPQPKSNLVHFSLIILYYAERQHKNHSSKE